MSGARKGIAVLGLVACLLVSGRAADRLAHHRPPRPPSRELGVGPLLGSVLAGSFRPLLQTYLWIRTDTLYGQGRMDELHRTFRTMLALYPDNDAAREFLGWHLAYNLKSESRRRPELAWRWARDGLDILLETRRGRRILAQWFLVQCGQNAQGPVLPLRYYGPAWEDERFWRARAAEWTKRHAGEPLPRFEAGLWALPESTRAYGLRGLLLEHGVYEGWILDGASARFEDADLALRTWTHEMVRFPAEARNVQERLTLLRLLEKRELRDVRALERRVEEEGSYFPYRAALAAVSLGARERRAVLVRTGLRALVRIDRRLNPDVRLLGEERAVAQSWLRELEGLPGEPLPLPSR